MSEGDPYGNRPYRGRRGRAPNDEMGYDLGDGGGGPRSRPTGVDYDPLTDPWQYPGGARRQDQGSYPGVAGVDRGGPGWHDAQERPRGRRRRAEPETGAYPGESLSSVPDLGAPPQQERPRGRRRRSEPETESANGSGAPPPEEVPRAREPWDRDPEPAGEPHGADGPSWGSSDEDPPPWAGTDDDEEPSWDGEPDDDQADHQTRMREAFERRRVVRPSRDGRRTKARKGGRRRTGKLTKVVMAVGLVLVVAAGGLALRTFVFPADFDGEGSGEVEVVIADGETGAEVGDTLAEEGVVASKRAFINALGGEDLTPGTYLVRSAMSADAAVAMLLDPSARVGNEVTIREGLRSSQILDLLAEETHLDREELQSAFDNHEALGLPDYAEEGAEGFLYPDTYPVEPDAEAEEVLSDMVTRFDQAAEESGLVDRAAEVDMTPNEVMANAGMIQAESGNAEDMPKISRVVFNRLDADMELGMDSTCFYAIEEYGIALSGSQLSECKDSDSDYATYGREGMPAGPIVSPGEDAINAALEPADGDWLYFVATDPENGVTEFAETSEEFESLKQEFNENREDE